MLNQWRALVPCVWLGKNALIGGRVAVGRKTGVRDLGNRPTAEFQISQPAAARGACNYSLRSGRNMAGGLRSSRPSLATEAMDLSQMDSVQFGPCLVLIIGRVAKRTQFPLHHRLRHRERMAPLRINVFVDQR